MDSVTKLLLAATPLCVVTSSSVVIEPPSAFDTFWNGPSGGCNPALPLANYSSIRVNEAQAFIGEEIACFYQIGAFPTVSASQNATACWTSHTPNCSWNPWDEINATANGGVPQAANISLHKAQVVSDVESAIPDPDFSGLLVVDWETWRPLASENYDGLSCYTEYSRRLVSADPDWKDKNASAIAAEGVRRFNAGAAAFFTATVDAVKSIRPNARVGFYSQGINQPASAGSTVQNELLWLWQSVDALFPSIYPRSTNVEAEATWITDLINGAIISADLAQNASTASGHPKRPAVFPYARALVSPGSTIEPFTAGLLATQVQIAAGLGADGVVLWGSSGDYHGNGCTVVAGELESFAGDTMDTCAMNRINCSRSECNGHGRCVDYDAANLEEICLSDATSTATCRCDVGYAGDKCEQNASSA